MEKLQISPQKFTSKDLCPYEEETIESKKKLTSIRSSNTKQVIHSLSSIANNDYIAIESFYYIDKNKLSLSQLKDGRRIFHNKTELASYDSNDKAFNQTFIEFRQLFFENLLLHDDFTENLKEPLTIQSALFSTFVYDQDFIEPLINTFKLKSIIIRHREDVKYNQMEEHENYIKFVFPKIDYTLRWGKFHSKLMLLKFPTFLRVVIPSANLTNGDWYYWGQIIWFQDFPLKRTHSSDEKQYDNDFAQYLFVFLKEFMPNNFEDKRFWTELNINLFDYDYSDCSVDLIATVNGRFKGKEKFQFGIGRMTDLCEYYNEQRPSMKKNDCIIAQCSSIGKSVRDKFYNDFYKGFNLTVNPSLDIIYPTEEYIKSFPLGKELSSCLFLALEAYQYHKSKFKKLELKQEYKSRKTVFHSKCFITCIKDSQKTIKITDNSILYFGSHNFSVAAWGNYEKGDSQISMANYELGIVFNPIKITLEEKQRIFKSLIIDFNSTNYKEQDYPFLNDFTT